jgi:hypothetical protein
LRLTLYSLNICFQNWLTKIASLSVTTDCGRPCNLTMLSRNNWAIMMAV